MSDKIEKKQNVILKFYPYKIFFVNNRHYLYTINAGGLFEINDEILELLKYEGKPIKVAYENLKSTFDNEKFSSLLEDMEEAGFLKIDDKVLQYTYDKGKISALTLMIIQECNLKCKYCYGDGGEYNDKGKMKKEVALQAVDFLIDETDCDNLSIAFLGGEPLLNFNLIKEVVKYCKMLEIDKGKKFTYSITTNGTLINREIEKFLEDNHFTIQISLDGLKDKHNKNRFFENGKGTYDIVIEKTKNLREKSLVSARATVTNDNLNYTEIFKHISALGYRAVPIAEANNMIDESHYTQLENENIKYIKYFEQLIKEKNFNEAKKMILLMAAIQKLEYGSERVYGCGVARHSYAVDINGFLYPCHRFVSNKKNSLGNIYKGVGSNREKFLKDINVHNRVQCKECWAQNLCLGGCPYENQNETGNIKESSSRRCKFMKKFFEELIKVYINMDDEDKKIFYLEN